MMSHLMLIGFVFGISFVLTSFLYSFLLHFETFRKVNFSALASVILGGAISSVAVLFFSWNRFDFVSNVSCWSFLAPLIGVLTIFFVCFKGHTRAVDAAVFIASAIGVFGGNLYIEFIPEYPVFINKICSTLVWFLFSLGFRVVGVLPIALQIQGLTVTAGFVLLFVFGASPFMLSLVAAAFFASMFVTYLNRNNQNFEVYASPLIGYIIGWFGLISYNEMLLPCFVVLTMLCLIEIAVSLLKKITFLKEYKDFEKNSFVVQVCRSGLPQEMLFKSFWTLSGVVIVFCIFQANGVNNYSIPVFVAIIIVWHFYRLINWKEDDKSWKDIKNETVVEVKETINTVVKNVSKTKKNKKEKGVDNEKAPKVGKKSKPKKL